MLGGSGMAGADVFQVASWLIGIPGLVLSYYTAIVYVPLIRANIPSRPAATPAGRDIS
jgi:cardiolipin synthase (CMP-forming)